MLNRCAAPEPDAPVLSEYAPMSTRSLPSDATEKPK